MDHQATSVNDATEESVGWYWQFNRMQGYKHTGSARTPNTTWISSIGSLYERGSYGSYLSRTQINDSNGWHLYFFSGFCDVSYTNKAYGFSSRCLRD
jgi:hypothetical protein